MITGEERKKLEKEFQILDENKDGKLSFEELKKGYKSIFTELKNYEELKVLFNQIDTDGSGFIDYQEFITAAIGTKNALSTKRLKKVFKILDKDKSGTITIKEISGGLLNIGQGGIQFFNSLLLVVGYDEEKEITQQEFIQMLQQVHKVKTSDTSEILSGFSVKSEDQQEDIIKRNFENKNNSIDKLLSFDSDLDLQTFKENQSEKPKKKLDQIQNMNNDNF